MAQQLTPKERARTQWNRANAKASTGPRTAAGKARASRNAITHGLAANGPIDEAEAADRDRRAAALAFPPEADVAFKSSGSVADVAHSQLRRPAGKAGCARRPRRRDRRSFGPPLRAA
jgi:hypothetical protein